MEESNGLLRLKNEHIAGAAKTLAQAFHDEPLKAYLYPDVKIRDEMAIDFFEFMLRYVVLFGEAYASSLNFEGVALWLPSEYAKMTPETMAKAGMDKLQAQLDKDFRQRIKPIYDFIDKKHAQNAPARHWYLVFIGVATASQGKGFAGKLIKPMLSRFKSENVPCYLETESQKNVDIYTHYGFKLIEKYFVFDTGLYFYSMLKE